MLACFKFVMRCETPGYFPGPGGEQLHALVFDLLRELDAGWAEEVHAARLKPFAIDWLRRAGEDGVIVWSPLRGRGTSLSSLPYRAAVSADALEEGQEYSFSVFSLSYPMYCALQEVAPPWSGRPVSVGAARFVGTDAREEVQLTTDYAGLVRHADDGPEVSGRRITFSFLTPTSFRRRGEQVLFPLPELVLGSLLTRWNALAPEPWPRDLVREEDLQSSMFVTRYRLRTEAVRFADFMLLGFVGDVSYTLRPGVPGELLWALATLSLYSFYAGIGYRTTMGMGRARGGPE